MKRYGVLALTQSSPAQSFTEPITLTQAAKFLELPERNPADDGEDALLSLMISTARSVAENLYGRDLVEKQYDLTLDSFYSDCAYGASRPRYEQCGSGEEITLREPLRSVDLVRYRDSDGTYHELTGDADYIVDLPRALIMPTYGNTWPSFTPWPSGAVMIQFTSGFASSHPFWSNDGQRLLLGMRQLISAWFTGRLPFEPATDIKEYPYAVTALFGFGAKRVVR